MPGPVIETLLLANHAEAMNGLLYMQGGGWVHHWRGKPKEDEPLPIAHIGIAMTILVPWKDTNRRHAMSVQIEHEDGGDPVVRIEGNYEVGRPPGTPAGSDQRSVLALNFELQFPKEGGYRLTAQTAESTRTISFFVHDSPPPGAVVT